MRERVFEMRFLWFKITRWDNRAVAPSRGHGVDLRAEGSEALDCVRLSGILEGLSRCAISEVKLIYTCGRRIVF